MKNIALSIVMISLLAACSSGSTVADLPFNITGLYNAEYENASGSRQETFVLNIAEDQTGAITGNIIFDTDPNDPSACAINSVVTGFTSGFSVTLVVTSGLTYQLTQSNSGRTLTGTYVSTGLEECSNASGSGTVVMNR